MHTYKRDNKEAVWAVGYFMPVREPGGNAWHRWTPLKDFNTEEGAAAYASYLNGGSKP